jgi:hypothetical protein
MSQFAVSDGQPGNWEEPDFFRRRLEIARFHENGWQEPCESRGSCTVLWGTGGEIPPVYPTLHLADIWFLPKNLSNLNVIFQKLPT